MHSFYLPKIKALSGPLEIKDKKQMHHIRDVLRLKPKDEIRVFDASSSLSCVIEAILPEGIRLSVKENDSQPLKNKKIILAVACAIPKHSKMDEIVDKLTQLGVDTIIPLKARRCIVRLDSDQEAQKVKRWMKVALAACEQCHRRDIPTIENPKSLKEALSWAAQYPVKLIPTLAKDAPALKDALAGLKEGKVIIFIGPEGDFSDEELKTAEDCGCVPVSLGDNILRVDTAAVAASAFVRLYADS